MILGLFFALRFRNDTLYDTLLLEERKPNSPLNDSSSWLRVLSLSNSSPSCLRVSPTNESDSR
ncbi:hypothetical protein FRACYDRAFT_268604 [Fragilariopsis cylindrus CCMP1102]|uniref:Uncharacterized protein n=1 Tax=Fragilariopsis cylindrus CCMP1102 TaxID=635003 RepID=A0A1E7FG91_9STRA|nr:hypothetical protein FRACYDRAFT_268604 [Fragilariopsis cylindrus CCMP1102]|eukprot:OEU17167.1 hypothetical protein FRACYDRAFT_268604 [Fragilariopsis cylindrus CCMP1102]